MPITAAHLLTNAITTNATSYTASASITPIANQLVLAAILSTKTAAPSPLAPTITGNGLTYVAIGGINFATVATGLYRLTLFRAMGATPTAGAPVISFGAVTQQGCGYAFSQFGGVDTSGTNGSGAIARTPVVLSGDGVTTLAPNLATPPFEAPNNATFACFAINLNSAITPEAGWTKLGTDIGFATPTARIESQYLIGNDTSPSATWASASAAAIAVEIRAVDSQRRAVLTWLALEVPQNPGGGPPITIFFPRKPPR